MTDTSEVVSIRTPVDLTFTNGVAFANFSGDGEDAVRKVLAPYQEHTTPLRWWVTPSSRPEDLSEALLRCGMRRVFQIPAMGATLSDINIEERKPEGFVIKPVLDIEELKVWSRTFTVGFQMPGESTFDAWLEAFNPFGYDDKRVWRLYVGYLNGEPVAISSMFLGSESAGIYHVVTLEEARGLGIGNCMTLKPLLEAREMGYKFGVLQSSQAGLSLYKRLGFREYFVADFFIWRPTAASP